MKRELAVSQDKTTMACPRERAKLSRIYRAVLDSEIVADRTLLRELGLEHVFEKDKRDAL